MFDVTLTTKGCCSGQPGPGGYAAVLRFGDKTKTVCGHSDRTNSHRMELQAIIEAVKLLKSPSNVTIVSESQVICNTIATARERAKNGWRTKSGARCANVDMWQELQNLGVKGKHHFVYQRLNGGESEDMPTAIQLAKENVHKEAHDGE